MPLVARDERRGLRAGQRRLHDRGRSYRDPSSGSSSASHVGLMAQQPMRRQHARRPAPEPAYLRFHRVPPRLSSRRMPRAARSSRMRSAAAKSRRRRAAWRSSISRSISAAVTGGCASSAWRSADHAEHAVEMRERSHEPPASSARRARRRRSPCSAARTRSNSTPRPAGGVEVVLRAPRRNAARASATRLRCTSGCAPPAVTRVEAGEKVGQAPQRLVGLLHRRPS